jgi:glycosyltransferase involved in cell wall biosynthesis
LVSFVMTAYCHERFVGEALSSLLAQQGGYAFEIVVVEDASTDRTAEVIRQFHDPRITCINNPRNLGVARSTSVGFSHARGKYVARVDSDDRWRPDFLLSTVPILDRYPEVGLVYADYATIDADGRLLNSRNVRRGARPARAREFRETLEDCQITTLTAIARREIWDRVLPWPEWLSGRGDWYLNMKMALLADFYYVDKVLGDYRLLPGGMHNGWLTDRDGEQGLRRILEEMLSAEGNGLSLRERSRIWARQLSRVALAHIGRQRYARALQVMNEAIARDPLVLAHAERLRHYLALRLGYERYLRLKHLLRRTGGKSVRA